MFVYNNSYLSLNPLYILTPSIFDMPSFLFHKLSKNVIFGSKGGPTFSRGGGRTQLLIPYRTCDFQDESGPPVTPTSSLGPCMTDPHKMILFHVLIMS